MNPTQVCVEILAHGQGLDLPAFETEGSAGADVRAAVVDPVTIEPGEIRLIPTGLRLAVPPGFEVQVRPRSGLALRSGITIPNSPGTIDSDYRGELKVILMNLGEIPFIVSRGERVAQLVLARVERIQWEAVASLDDTARGEGGFGHTGI